MFKNTSTKFLISLLLVAALAAGAVLLWLCLNVATEIPPVTEGPPITLPTQATEPPTEATEPPTETTQPEPQPEQVVATATIGAMGDLLMHGPLFNYYTSATRNGDGTYNFESVFRYLTPYTTALDYAAINLETTLCGLDNGYEYSGFPKFNCPDEIIDGAKDAGFDMILTANNHSYDTDLVGFKRTVEVVRDRELEALGTYLSADEQKWVVKEINGIQVGMVCYTYASYVSKDGRPSLNGNPPVGEPGLCNYFFYDDLEPFYQEISGYLEEMEAAGAEATIVYIHWGVEYQLKQNYYQEDIAQALCDMGVDVIIGGHPHVVQPMELLTSEADPEHKTVCIYSLGNAVSNQRLGNISYVDTPRTEDGALFTVTFEKYSDGTVYLAETDLLPIWVNMHDTAAGKREYNILPLDMEKREEWETLFETTPLMAGKAEASYYRTMETVEEGLREAQDYLAQQKQAREEYYYNLAYNPQQPTEATVG